MKIRSLIPLALTVGDEKDLGPVMNMEDGYNPGQETLADYELNAGDRLQIEVYEESTLSSDYTRADESASLSLSCKARVSSKIFILGETSIHDWYPYSAVLKKMNAMARSFTQRATRDASPAQREEKTEELKYRLSPKRPFYAIRTISISERFS